MIQGNSTDIAPHQFHHFLNQILHCVKLGKDFGGVAGVEKMLTKILCVGSDFDGLIEPSTGVRVAKRSISLEKDLSVILKKPSSQMGFFCLKTGVLTELPTGYFMKTEGTLS
ncbi:hypothetical protein [Algoriphagus boritolerans]|uniref:hypothetical protein n=1 Tax=Algoriphagus boritolerans TaxID=308111 RepID=UPI000A5CB028